MLNSYRKTVTGRKNFNTPVTVRVESANSYNFSEGDRVFLSVPHETDPYSAYVFLNAEQALELAYHIINILQQQGELND